MGYNCKCWIERKETTVKVMLDLSTQEGYDVACALRGPDSIGNLYDRSKYVFTGLLRHLCGCDAYLGIIRDLPCTEDDMSHVLNELTRIGGSLDAFSLHHWMHHLLVAYSALGPVYPILCTHLQCLEYIFNNTHNLVREDVLADLTAIMQAEGEGAEGVFPEPKSFSIPYKGEGVCKSS